MSEGFRFFRREKSLKVGKMTEWAEASDKLARLLRSNQARKAGTATAERPPANEKLIIGKSLERQPHSAAEYGTEILVCSFAWYGLPYKYFEGRIRGVGQHHRAPSWSFTIRYASHDINSSIPATAAGFHMADTFLGTHFNLPHDP